MILLWGQSITWGLVAVSTTPCAFLMELTFRLPPEGQLAIEVSKMKGLGGVAEDTGPESSDESKR